TPPSHSATPPRPVSSGADAPEQIGPPGAASLDPAQHLPPAQIEDLARLAPMSRWPRQLRSVMGPAPAGSPPWLPTAPDPMTVRGLPTEGCGRGLSVRTLPGRCSRPGRVRCQEPWVSQVSPQQVL